MWDEGTHGGSAKGMPRNDVEGPSVKPMTVASLSFIVGAVEIAVDRYAQNERSSSVRRDMVALTSVRS